MQVDEYILIFVQSDIPKSLTHDLLNKTVIFLRNSFTPSSRGVDNSTGYFLGKLTQEINSEVLRLRMEHRLLVSSRDVTYQHREVLFRH